MTALPFVYLPISEVRRAVGIGSDSGLYRKVREGKFPPPDRIDGRVRWRSDVVAAWLNEHAARAEAEREETTKTAREKGQRMLAARGKAAA